MSVGPLTGATIELTNWRHRGRYCVVWRDPEEDICILIESDQTTRSRPFQVSWKELVSLCGTPRLIPVDSPPDPRSQMTDAQLNELYPPVGEETESYVIRYRRDWNATIKPIIADAEKIWRGELTIRGAIVRHLGRGFANVQRVYEVLYRFWASGSKENRLLPETQRCGHARQKRAGNSNKSLGRKRLAVAESGGKNDNFPLTRQIIEEIQTAWRRFVRRHRGPKSAYRLYLGTHWVERWEGTGKALKPILKPRGQRPSFDQFYEHGQSQSEKERAFRKMLGETLFNLTARAFEGRPVQKTFRTGAVGQIDASSGDTYLRSVFDRRRDVGPCRVIFVVDEENSYIYGFYVGWRINSQAVRLAVLHAASNKVEFCARYGRVISPDQWYSALIPMLYADRGEVNCETVRDELTGLECTIVYVRSHRGDDKAVVEQTHRRMHRHSQPGSTHGKNRERGEPDPAKEALFNIDEFTADLIDAVLWANNEQIVPRLIKSWMPPTVEPTRKGILDFSRANGYDEEHLFHHQSDLIVKLCPTYRATVTRHGVFLLVPRYITHGDEIMLSRYCYRPPPDVWRAWSEKVAREGHRDHIEVFVIPFDMSHIHFLHPEVGLLAFELSTDDPKLASISVLEDAIQRETWDKIGWEPLEEASLQSAVARDLAQAAREKNAKDDLARTLKETPGPTSAGNATKRRDNRKEEERLGGHAPYAMPPHVRSSSEPAPSSPSEVPKRSSTGPQPTEPDPVEVWLTGQ